MAFPLILIPIGLAALLSACGGSEEEEEKPCLDPQQPGNDLLSCLPPVDEERPVYNDDPYEVVADPEISKSSAGFYLSKIPEFERKVEDLFGISSPWRGNIMLALLHKEGPDERLIEWRGHADVGYVDISIPGRDMELFNNLASRGEYFHEGIFVHEFSHALRHGIADFSALLEEGLATYTQIYARSDDAESVFPSSEQRMTGIECVGDGYRIYADVRNKEGDLEREYLNLPRSISLDILNTYARGFCFWNTIRENHGHSAVQAIVQSMVEFSRENENVCDPYAGFPFFETFMAATGMDEVSARAYFDVYYLPTDDDSYPLGGVSWQGHDDE